MSIYKSLGGGGRTVIIILRTNLNVDWCDIAFKIERFFNCFLKLDFIVLPRETKTNNPYVKRMQESKWKSKNHKEVEVKIQKENIDINVDFKSKADGCIKLCLVRYIQNVIEEKPPYLALEEA